MPKLLDIEKFCEELEEVKSPKYFQKKKKFNKDGLFSEQIFGPVKSHTCQCGTYLKDAPDEICKICEVKYSQSMDRRRKFAKIILPLKVVNPIFYDFVVSLISKEKLSNLINLKSFVERLMYDKDTVCYEDNSGLIVVKKENLEKHVKYYEKLEGVKFLVRKISEYLMEDSTEWKMVNDKIDSLITNKVIIIPPDFRPIFPSSGVADSINDLYSQILIRSLAIKGTSINNDSLYYDYYKPLQLLVNELYQYVIKKLSKKEGLIRSNILGKRIDFSARAVISPDPTLNLDECSLPYRMVLELFRIDISRWLIEHEKFNVLNKADEYIDECIKTRNLSLFEVCNKVVKHEYCLLNRQPTLHRLSIQGFKIKVNKDNVIKIHPLVCEPYNADFDGDQMAVYIPITNSSREEIKNKFLITNNLFNPSNLSLTTTPNQDIIYGIFILTSDKIESLNNIVIFKDIEMTEGQMLFNECLPEDYLPIIEKEIGKKKLINILNDILVKYNSKEMKIVLDKIKSLGFKYSTIFGTTMSLWGFNINRDKIKNEIFSDDVKILNQLSSISSEVTESKMREEFEYSDIIESGSRGTWDQARQIILTRGFISDYRGNILTTPIKGGLIDGLNRKEFFLSTYGSRKGLLDTAINTGISGHLSRKLDYTGSGLQIGKNKDCGTIDYLKVYVDNKKKAKMLIGRYYVNAENKELELINNNNIDSLIGRSIFIRSPIYCLDEKICKTCYGKLSSVINSRFIGMIASHCLGECNTQLIMRTFHTSGVAMIGNDKSMEQKDVASNLPKISNVFHNVESVFDPSSYTKKIFNMYIDNKEIHHVHFECIVSQMMWNGMKKWRLLKNRNNYKPKFESVLKVPSIESWLLGFSFYKPKQHLLHGLIYSGEYKGILDNILKGEIYD